MFGEFTFTLTHFLTKHIFPEAMGGVQNSSGYSGGVGRQLWKVGEEGGLTLNSPHGGGMDIFCNYTFLILSDKSCFH